jgi:hypothetical protein
MTVPAFSNICIIEPVTVGRLQGQVIYRLEGKERLANDISVEIRRYDADHTLVAETRTDAEGKFSLGKVAPGKYELRLYSPAATLSVEVRAVRPGLFHWYPANWLNIGLGLVPPEGCPDSYVKAKRQRSLTMSVKLSSLNHRLTIRSSGRSASRPAAELKR